MEDEGVAHLASVVDARPRCETVSCLRSLPAEDVLKAYLAIPGGRSEPDPLCLPDVLGLNHRKSMLKS